MADKALLKQLLERQDYIAKYLRKNYINPYLEGELLEFNLKPKKDLHTDKIMWQFWGQGVDESTHPVVKSSFFSVGLNKGDYERIILNNNTIRDYIDLPDFVYEKLKTNKNYNYAFFSDVLRVSLLSAYGGVWLDATILLTDKIPSEILDSDFFAYQRGKRPDNFDILENQFLYYWCWDKNFKVNLLNSFIVAKKNHKIINALKNILLNYWLYEDCMLDYFLFQILFDELMKIDEFKQLNCDIVSDYIPHRMQYFRNSEYSNELWNFIVSECSIHKLSYYNCSPDSIFGHAISLYNPV